MPIDERLAREARTAAHDAERLQHELDTARSTFQRAVRALHTTGATPAEIAETLEISHHRVHQLLGDRRLTCSFCGRNQSELRKLICGPDGIAICCDCVGPVTTVVRHGTPAADTAPAEEACSFCEKQPGPVATHAGTSICAECLDLCHEILAEDARP